MPPSPRRGRDGVAPSKSPPGPHVAFRLPGQALFNPADGPLRAPPLPTRIETPERFAMS
jgi:hypothetical protein